jgi:prepilin-type processing-associated H-X9-DG protein
MATENAARSKPVDVKVHVSTGAGVNVAWADGHNSHYEFAYLRDHCPCAVCEDERGRRPSVPGSAALPLYKPKVTARAASAVGHYALQFDFSDGHATGIYSFDLLRELCPCDACRAAAAGAAKPT